MLMKKPGNDLEIVSYEDAIITMRDGTRLAAAVYFPGKGGKADVKKKYPVLLVRSGYRTVGFEGFWNLWEYAAAAGYVTVLVAARGTYRSEGQLHPLANEGWGPEDCPDRNGWGTHRDGQDTIDWVKRQPWCDGRVVTTGMSWMGASQLLPWLADNECGLETSAIYAPAMNSGYGNWGYENGFFTLELQIQWALILLKDQVETGRYSPKIVEEIKKDLELLGNPLEDMNFVMGTSPMWAEKFIPKYGLMNTPVLRHISFFKKWVENYGNLDFFSYNDTAGRKHAFNKPLLFSTGYYDVFCRNTVWAYEQAVKDAPTKEIADGHRLVLTPYNHTSNRSGDMWNTMKIDRPSLVMSWFEQRLNGVPADVLDKGHAFIYVQGEEKWRAEPVWPISDTRFTKYYLHSDGHANTDQGDGTLSVTEPGAEAADHYDSDPSNPVPALFAHRILDGSYGDERENGKREDCLVYNTPILEEDVEVTGWINATIYAATSATDTDFMMKLMDVCPDGSVRHVSMGGVRGRYRKDLRAPEAMVPGQIEKMDIPMHVSSCMFKKGHRIRVEIVSTCAYMYDINPNQFIDLRYCTEKDYVVAHQTIYHDAEHPSSITLPIIPADHEAEWIEWPYTPEKTGGDFEGEFMGQPSFAKWTERSVEELPLAD